MYSNTATFRHSDWPLHEAVRAPPSLNAYLTLTSPPLLHFSSSSSLITRFHSFARQHTASSHMSKNNKDELIHIHARVHPPFPSFAWVMTAQANPPTQRYAYGYIRNAQALHPRLLAHRTTPRKRHNPHARSLRPLPSPARAKIELCDEKFMVGRSTMDFCGG